MFTENFGDVTTARTLSNIKKSLSNNLKEKYNIADDKVVDSFLKIHGLNRDNFDFISSIEKVMQDRLNDVSIDSNSNKNEKTIEGINQECIAPVKKAVGYDYLYRTIKELYSKEEAKRLIGEMLDLSLGLSDSTQILKPYSYYGYTPLIVKINGKIELTNFKKIYDKFSYFSKKSKNMEEILSKDIKQPVLFNHAIIGKKVQKTVKCESVDPIKEDIEIEVWDSDKWVGVSRIIKHKRDTGMIIYQTENGDYAFVTDNHPIYMENKTEKIARNLKIGDEVLKKEKLPIFEENIDVPINLAYLLGFICGDGNTHCYENDPEYENNPCGYLKFIRGGNLVSIYQKDIDNTKIVSVIKKIFSNVKLWKFQDSNDRQINFTSQWLNRLCSDYLGYGYKENSFTKTLPKNIFNWKRLSKIAFISGLIDSEGTIFKEDGRIDIRMRSYSVITGLYDLLKNLNVPGVRKRLAISSSNNMKKNKKGVESDIMFGVSFKPIKEMLKFSGKIQSLSKGTLEKSFSYNPKNSTCSRSNRVSKIITNIPECFFNYADYVYDITTDTGSFYANGMTQHNCWALDASKIITVGRDFGQLHSKPSKRVSSYISALCETLHQLSNHLAGALAVSTFFLDISHLSLYKERVDLRELKTNKKFRKYLENEMQQFVHSVNHLSRNAVESPFTNISVFDRTKLKTILKDMDWYFPFDDLPIEHEEYEDKEEKKEFYTNYIIDYIIEIQNIFLDFFDKGDPLKSGIPYRFPIVTINFGKKKWGDKEIIQDDLFLKSMCRKDIFRYNIFVSEGQKFASCCRLINNAEMMDFAAQSNSFGGGGSVSLGSHRVCTINFNRVALEAATKEEFYDILDHRIEDAAKILKAHKELIKKLEHIGLQPFITNGWININRLFSTFGIMGIYEATKLYKEKFGNGTDIEGLFLTFMNDKVKEYSQKYGIIGNIEQIPGESFSSRLCNADKLIFGEKKVPYMLYANQFVPLWEESTVWDKMDIDGKYNKLITGGGIVHIQIGEKVTAKQAEKLIKYAVTSGCEHFALNAVYSECENNHNTIGKKDVCPECGAKIIEYRTRVVGFFVPVSSWDKVRREWEFPKRKFSIITEEFGLIESHSEGLTLVKQCA